MPKKTIQLHDSLSANLTALESFWNRRSFHDMEVESIVRRNGRVIFYLSDYLLVLVDVKKYQAEIEELPTVWLNSCFATEKSDTKLTLQLELGTAEILFHNLRLIDRNDMTVIIPKLD